MITVTGDKGGQIMNRLAKYESFIFLIFRDPVKYTDPQPIEVDDLVFKGKVKSRFLINFVLPTFLLDFICVWGMMMKKEVQI